MCLHKHSCAACTICRYLGAPHHTGGTAKSRLLPLDHSMCTAMVARTTRFAPPGLQEFPVLSTMRHHLPGAGASTAQGTALKAADSRHQVRLSPSLHTRRQHLCDSILCAAPPQASRHQTLCYMPAVAEVTRGAPHLCKQCKVAIACACTHTHELVDARHA